MLSLLKKNNSREYVYIICILISLSSIGSSQDKSWLFSFKKNPVNSNNMWIEKNNFGRDVSDLNFDTYFEIKQSNFTYIFNIFSNVNQQKVENIYLHESFIKYKFSDKTFFRIGQYYRDFSQYLNDELSSGSMLISNNAEPMPKIGLVSSAKIKKNPNITFNFGVSHGEFEKNDYYDKKPLLHEKFIYLNVKKDNYKFGVGLVHEAIWGGSTFFGGDEPSEFKDFLKIIISADGPLIEGQSHANALGNHLGLWDFYYQKNYKNQILKLYYQHFFEDTSGLRFHNRFDGLWGLELNNYIPDTTILLEYLDTSNQNIDPPYV